MFILKETQWNSVNLADNYIIRRRDYICKFIFLTFSESNN
jgi:hypothetical protein